MTVVSTLDVHGLTAQEYRAVMDELGVETRPEGGIYLHLTTSMELGFRVVEIWDEKQGFDRFVEQRLAPAGEAVGHNCKNNESRLVIGAVGTRSSSEEQVQSSGSSALETTVGRPVLTANQTAHAGRAGPIDADTSKEDSMKLREVVQAREARASRLRRSALRSDDVFAPAPDRRDAASRPAAIESAMKK